VLVAATPLKVWFLDTTNWLNAINVVTGEVFSIAPLPRDAEITAIAVGADAVYAADGRNSRLYTLDLKTEQLTPRSLPFIGEHTLMSVATDGRIWFAAEDQSQLISYDPHGKRVELVETGMSGVAAIALDDFSRVWFTDGDRSLASYDIRTGLLRRMRLSSKGAAHVLLPDPSGSIWIGTTAGEVISVRDGVQQMPLVAARPISALALDNKGVTWYLTPARAERGGFVAGRVYGGEDSFTVPGAATSLSFTLGGRIWLADPAGGFYLSTDAPK
jgi:streptogramin lyase